MGRDTGLRFDACCFHHIGIARIFVGMSDESDFPLAVEQIRHYFHVRSLPEVVSVYLFGSEARGQAHRESDVDVAVLLDRSRVPRAADRAERRVRLGADLIAAAGRNDIDLVMLNDVPPGLGRAVILAGTRIFCADPELDHAFRRDVQLRAADLDPFLTKMRRLKLKALRS
jgi:uncharacterized protein